MRAALLAALLPLTPAALSALQQPTARPDTTSDSTRAAARSPQALRRVLVTGTARPGYGAATAVPTRTGVPLRETPQAATVVSRELIADQAMQGMADVVRYVPGVTMGQGEGHRDAPTIRGQATTADFFVDGMRDDAQYLRDLYNVDRVEALRGANALLFGRGGGGGAINRVTKDATWAPTRALSLEGGSFDHKRGTLDVGGPLGRALGARAAARLNAVWERSGGFRDAARLDRVGANPTATLVLGRRTVARAGYEYFADRRTVDRGIPSFAGRPADAPVGTFFGDPDASRSRVVVHAASALVEHDAGGGVVVRNRARVAGYDKFYRNVFPGALDAAGARVTLQAYDNATDRVNVLDQTDVTWSGTTGPLRHALLAGVEVGRQVTDNLRHTGYFGGTATSTTVPFARPTLALPVEFRQSATDADNHVVARTAAGYVQDQLALGSRVQLVGGVRLERLELTLDDRRSGAAFRRVDRVVSPRVGVVVTPTGALSLYGSRSVSFLPSAGDQFSSLTATTRSLEPERFVNREVGAKWDPTDRLSLTAAAYRLERSNTAAPDPADPSHTVQTGRQRTTGWELGVSGEPARAWQVAGAWSSQRATIVSRTAAARAGATVPLVPAHALSLWNRVGDERRGVGLGVIHQSRMYAAIDNAVTLPAFTRVDAALYAAPLRRLRLQLNVENLLDRRYFATSHGNNNIMPGAPRTVRLGATTSW